MVTLYIQWLPVWAIDVFPQARILHKLRREPKNAFNSLFYISKSAFKQVPSQCRGPSAAKLSWWGRRRPQMSRNRTNAAWDWHQIGSIGKALPHIEYWIKFERNSCLWINKLGLSLWGNIFFFENKIYRKCWNKIIGLRVDFHLAKSLSSHERGSDFQHCQSQGSFACKLGRGRIAQIWR